MPWQVLNIELLLPAFALVLFRVSGIVIGSPLVGSRALPPQIKIAFTVVVSMMMFPLVWPTVPTGMTLAVVVTKVMGELLIGLTIGFAVDLIFLGVRLAGMMIGQQAGIALGQVFNPMLDGQSTIVGQVYFLVSMMVFLAIGGHRVMVRTLLDTFETIPPGSFRFNASILTMIERLMTDTFIAGLRLAAPALTALFIASLTMGFIARTIPQLNILTIGFSMRIFVGLSVAGISLALSYELLYDLVLHTFDVIRATLSLVPI